MKQAPSRSTEPSTFRARGVAAPFTAPMLASARVRAADRGGVELVVPNPSGGAGVFITDWSGAAALRGATMHDTVLHQRIARAGAPDPRQMREAALDVAEEGHAGPVAAAAARNRRDSDAKERTRIRELILFRCRQRDGTQPAERMLARVTDLQPGVALAALQVCCDAFGPLGLALDDRAARLPRAIAALEETAHSIGGWLAEDAANDGDGIGATMQETLRAASAMGWAFLDGLRRCALEAPSLLRRAAADPRAVREQADRALWLMDGWERPALLWQAADGSAMRRLALLEIAQGLPGLPTEALGWRDPPVSASGSDLTCRVSFGGNARLSSASAMTLVRRNETLRALSL